MPSGKVHAFSTLVTAWTAGPLLVLAGSQPIDNALAFMGGCFLGLVVTPDLDIDHWTRSHTLMRRSTGWLGASLWYLFWWPYARLIPHRSPLSHMPILGTILRLLYIIAIPGLIWLGLYVAYGVPLPTQWPTLHPYWGWGLGGLMLVDALHAFLDAVS